MKYINSLQNENRQLRKTIKGIEAEIQLFIEYLASPKFQQDTTIQTWEINSLFSRIRNVCIENEIE